MSRIKETVSSKRGRERLKKHGDKYVTRYMKLLDKGYQMAMADDAKFAQVMQVAEEYRGAIEQTFGRPKQEIDLNASVITPDVHLEIARALQQQAMLIQSGKLLVGGNDAINQEGQEDNAGDEEGIRGEAWDEGILCVGEQGDNQGGSPQEETEVIDGE